MIGTALIAAALCSTCPQQVCVQQHVQAQYVAPVVAPQVYYFVGAPIRAQALVQQDPDYKEFLEFKQWKQQTETAPQAPQTGVAEMEQAESSIVKAICGKCHAEAKEANGFFALTGDESVNSEHAMKAIKAIAYGEMPKDRELSKQEKDALLAELFSLTKGLE